MAQVAQAAIPSGGFLNPDATAGNGVMPNGTGGPFNVISDAADGTDGTYHFVLHANSGDAGQGITSVALQIEDGDLDNVFESIGNMTQVSDSDGNVADSTWEFSWDVGAHLPTADVDNDAGTVRAVVSDAGGEIQNIDVTVTFAGSTGNTVEITNVTNGGTLGFFGGATTLSGTGSAGVNAAGEVDLFYTTSLSTVLDPVWTSCGETAGVVTAPATTATWSGTCALQGGDLATAVTGVAARADTATENDTGEALESGDAHRVTGYVQDATGATVTITPSSDNQTTGFCNGYVVQAIDSLGRAILGAEIDVTAVGPGDAVDFAADLDDTSIVGDFVSDPFDSTSGTGTGETGFEAAAGCDSTGFVNGVGTADADSVGEDLDSQDASGEGPTVPSAEDAGEQSVSVVAGNDIKHIEGATDNDGFEFAIAYPTGATPATGSTALVAWWDVNGNEIDDGAGEPNAAASKNWQAGVATTVDGTPENAIVVAGNNHTFTCVATDQNGNPRDETCHFDVTSGPDAEQDNDANPATPAGYLGSCITGADGVCTLTFTAVNQGSDLGTDVVDIFVNSSDDSGVAVFVADADDPKDPGGVTVTYTSATGGGATCIDVDPNTETVGVTGTQVFTAFVTTGTFNAANDGTDTAGEASSDCSGTPVVGVAVDWDLTGDDTPDVSIVSSDSDSNLNTERTLTDAAGATSITIDNVADAAGTNDWGAAAGSVMTDIPGASEAADPANDHEVAVTWATAGAAAAIDCTPEDSLNADGTLKSFSATVVDAFGTAVAGVNVDAQIMDGPNSTRDVDSNPATPVGYVGEGTTNASGVVNFSYTGVAGATNASSDVINCFRDVNDNDLDDGEALEDDGSATAEEQTDAGEQSDFIDALWKTSAEIANANVEMDLVTATADYAPGTTPPTPNCGGALDANFGGATWEAASTNDVNNVHLVCVSVVQAGAGDQPELTGATVTLTSTGVGTITDNNGPPPSLTTQDAQVATDGYARFYIFSTTAGVQNLVASAAGVTDTDSGAKTWQVANGEARIIDCEPETQTRQVNTQATVTCTVTDGFTNPVAGVAVTFTRTEANGSTSTIVSQQTTSDANGVTFITINSATPGTTTVTGAIQAATTECEELAGAGQGGNDTGKPAGVCSDSTDVNWQTQALLCPGRESEPGNHIVGTSGDDTLTGTAGVDVICGLEGDDTIDGLGGDDLLDGGDGRDIITGDAGDDRIFGGNGNDTLKGDTGNDTVNGGAGDDLLNASLGDDSLDGGGGIDEVDFFESTTPVNANLNTGMATSGTTGTDTLNNIENLTGGAAGDTLTGDAGNNILDGVGGPDLLRGGGGNDFLYGGTGFDTMYGDNGEDRLFGNNGNDKGYGGSGADRVFGGGGDDILYGGADNDRIGGGIGSDRLFGGTGPDVLLGGDGPDHLFGGNHRDRMFGMKGSDKFHARDGKVDLVSGGTGRDNCSDRDRIDDTRSCP